ncbi:MAG: hypothetical protein U0Q16_03540 [Bryobacteraceae bacterium]
MPVVEELRCDLSGRGLPKGYIDRVCGELADHLEECEGQLRLEGHDPLEAGSISAERLGCPKALAERFHAERLAMSFSLRHPLVSTAGMTVAVFLALAAARLGVMVALWEGPEGWLMAASSLSRPLAPALGGAVLYWFCRCRFGSRVWFGLAAGILLALSFTSVVRVEAMPNNGSRAVLRLIP